MMELDDLKAVWKTQPAQSEALSTDRTIQSLTERLEKQRRNIFWSNVLGTVCMLLTASYMVYLLFQYPNEPLLFQGSLVALATLCLMVIVVLWRRSLHGVDQFTKDQQTFIRNQLKRIRRTEFMIRYSPFYGFLLGILVNTYAYSLISAASPYFVFWAINLTWVYIIAVSYLSYRVKIRKFDRNMRPLLQELEDLSKKMSN